MPESRAKARVAGKGDSEGERRRGRGNLWDPGCIYSLGCTDGFWVYMHVKVEHASNMCHSLHVSYTHDKAIYLNHLFQTMNHLLYVEDSIIT